MESERASARTEGEREKLVIKEVPARHQGEELQQLGDFVNRSSLCRHSNTRASHAPFCPCARSSATRADVQNLVRKRRTLCFPNHFNSLFVRRQTVRVPVSHCARVREGGTDRKRCVRLHGDLLLSSNKTHCTRENARAHTLVSSARAPPAGSSGY